MGIKIPSLPEQTLPEALDELPVEDESTSTTKRLKLSTLLSFIMPVGTIYENSQVSTNPAVLFGFGTWVACAPGMVLVGLDATQAEFNELGETGGEKTHVLTTAELATHLHTVNPPNVNSGGNSRSHAHIVNIAHDSAGGGSAVWSAASNTVTNSPQYGVFGSTGTEDQNHVHGVDIPEFNSGNQGSGTAHNNLPPYKVVHRWERTA